MAGVWGLMTLFALVVLIPATLGSYLIAERAPRAVVNAWFTFLTAVLAVCVILLVVAMPKI